MQGQVLLESGVAFVRVRETNNNERKEAWLWLCLWLPFDGAMDVKACLSVVATKIPKKNKQRGVVVVKSRTKLIIRIDLFVSSCGCDENRIR